MSNFVIFVVGVGVTLVAGMGVITSQVFLGYKPLKREFSDNKVFLPKVSVDHQSA